MIAKTWWLLNWWVGCCAEDRCLYHKKQGCQPTSGLCWKLRWSRAAGVTERCEVFLVQILKRAFRAVLVKGKLLADAGQQECSRPSECPVAPVLNWGLQSCCFALGTGSCFHYFLISFAFSCYKRERYPHWICPFMTFTLSHVTCCISLNYIFKKKKNLCGLVWCWHFFLFFLFSVF